MAELKTKKNNASVEAFLNGIENEKRKKDSFAILKLLKNCTKNEPRMWGSNIVGFGNHHYKYESAREGDWFSLGFSPGKQHLTVYIMTGFSRYGEIMKRLGKYKTGKSCLYINKLEDVDINVLEEIVQASTKYLTSKA